MPRPMSDDPKVFNITLRCTKSERERLERDRGSRTLTEHMRFKLFGRKG